VWVVGSVLGSGAMGSVLLCHNRHAPRISAAIKLLGQEMCTVRGALSRFAREAEVLHSLDHPNIVKVRNVRLDGPDPHLEMEVVDGKRLEDLVQDGPIPLDDALLYAEQLASAVRYLHRHGVCHRDIKPANVLLWRGVVVKLVDFGLALASDGERITEAGASFGTVAYAPPEWVTPEDLDPRAWDLYAIGVVLYEMLTGELAFTTPASGSPRQTALRVMTDKQSVPFLDPGASIPEPVRALVRRLTARRPEDRPHHAREVVETLQRLLAERGIDPDRKLLAAYGVDESLAGQLAVGIGRAMTPLPTPLAGRLEQTTHDAPPRPMTLVPEPPLHAPFPALIAAVVAVTAVVTILVLVGTVGLVRWADRGAWDARVDPVAGVVAFVAGETTAGSGRPAGSLVTEGAYAQWLEEHRDWDRGRAVRKGLAGEGYLDGFESKDAGGAPMVGVSYAAAAAYCASRGGVAPIDTAPTTWSGSVPQEWRAGDGAAALRSRTGTVIPSVIPTWVEPRAGFRCAR
jgi:hypothetical protein